MGKFVKAAKKADLSVGAGMVVQVEGKEIALFNKEGSFYAIDNSCSHQGGPLGEGYLEESTVTCPWHGWEYDVTTGVCRTNPAAHQAQYKVKVEGEDILIEV